MAYFRPNDSDHTLSLPPNDPTWQSAIEQSNQDRYRLGRELARDFEDASFSSVAPPGEDTDTMPSIDVGKDANATSTKRLSPQIPMRGPAGRPGTMLYQTPTIDSRLMRDHFVDFTMAAEDVDNTDSYEIGRGRPQDGAGVSFVDQSTDVFSLGVPSARKNESKKRTAGGKLDDKRRGSFSSQDGAPASRRNNVRKPKAQGVDRSLGSPVQRSSPFPTTLNFDPPAVTPKRGKSRFSSGSGDRHAKVTDYVSNSGSGGSRGAKVVNPPANPRDSEEDALSDIVSTGRQRFGRSRFQRNASAASSPAGVRKGDEDLTGDVPAILSRTRKNAPADTVPKSFKSTSDFLKELGLDGHTQTINLQMTLRELKDVGPSTSRPRTTATKATSQPPARNLNLDPSFAIPNIPDMTDLFSGNDVTRFSAKKGASAKSHVPIDSIPIPHDTRAMLTAMRLLQEKVANLEGSKAANEQKCAKLESELRRAEVKYQQETRRARLAEEEMRRRGRLDSALGGSGDGNAEKTRVDLMMEKLKLESIITNLRDDIQQIQSELQTAKITLQNMQEERNAAINSVAMAIASNEDLKAANNDLRGRLGRLEYEKRQAERRTTRQHEEYRAREERLREYAREARQAAAIAEQAMAEAARHNSDVQESSEREAALKRREEREIERQKTERLAKEQAAEEKEEEREEQRQMEIKWEFDRRVEEQLRKIRPDLFEGRDEPFTVPSAPLPQKETGQADGRKKATAVTRRQNTRPSPSETTSEAEIVPEPKGKGKGGEHLPPAQQETVAGPSGAVGDETSMSISPDEIRRLAKEINAERKKRKAAAAAEKVRQEEERQREIEQQREEEARQAERIQQEAQETQATQPVTEPAPKKGRKVLKVVYLMDGDATEIRNLEEEMEGLKSGETVEPALTPATTSAPAAHPAPAASQPVQEPVVEDTVTVELPKEPEAALVDEEEATKPQLSAPPTLRVEFKLPPPASLPLHIQSPLPHSPEDHDPQKCTVCVRYDDLRRREEEMERENPLKDIDNSCVFPAPELEPVSKRSGPEGPFEEEATLRPSVSPQTQLERVVRQLKDEFRHLKLIYQNKSEEFIQLDPAVKKRRRKVLTREMNELVAEMDAKSDQIYALYDVNEEFVEREKGKEYEIGEETEDLIRSLSV